MVLGFISIIIVFLGIFLIGRKILNIVHERDLKEASLKEELRKEATRADQAKLAIAFEAERRLNKIEIIKLDAQEVKDSLTPEQPKQQPQPNKPRNAQRQANRRKPKVNP